MSIGSLFVYSERLVAFAAGAGPLSTNIIVLIGGLGDSLLCVPFFSSLVAAAAECGWSVVQVGSSSHGLRQTHADSSNLLATPALVNHRLWDA